MVAARNAQPPTSTASDQERKTLQEKIALIQSDDEVNRPVGSIRKVVRLVTGPKEIAARGSGRAL